MKFVNYKIYNGPLELVISETLCCDPEQGVRLQVPITEDKQVEFRLVFNSSPEETKRGFSASQRGDVVVFEFMNFSQTLGSSLTQPFGFEIGKDKYFFQVYGSSAGKNSMLLTLSIYRGDRHE